jgi:hypothetical protein
MPSGLPLAKSRMTNGRSARSLSRTADGCRAATSARGFQLSRQPRQLLQLVDDRIDAPELNALFGHERHFVAKPGHVPDVDGDRPGIQPAVLPDIRYRAERNMNLSNVVGHVELPFVHPYPLQTGVGPQDEGRSQKPNSQKHKHRLRRRHGVASIFEAARPKQDRCQSEPDIQTDGSTNFTQNVQAEDRTRSCMTFAVVSRVTSANDYLWLMPAYGTAVTAAGRTFDRSQAPPVPGRSSLCSLHLFASDRSLPASRLRGSDTRRPGMAAAMLTRSVGRLLPGDSSRSLLHSSKNQKLTRLHRSP